MRGGGGGGSRGKAGERPPSSINGFSKLLLSEINNIYEYDSIHRLGLYVIFYYQALLPAFQRISL